MPNGSGEGLKEALAAFEPAAEPVQGEIFEDLEPEITGALDAPSPLSTLFRPRGRGGRKPGSKNRLTTSTAKWLLSQARHPLLVLAEAYSMTPAQLADQIGLKRGIWQKEGEGKDAHWVLVDADSYDNETLLAIYKLQLGSALDLAPYVARKQAQEVELAGAGGGDLVLTFGGVSLPARGGGVEAAGGPAIEPPTLRLPAKSDD
jgi:hypothetical protein